jgi:hypothetical protein
MCQKQEELFVRDTTPLIGDGYGVFVVELSEEMCLHKCKRAKNNYKKVARWRIRKAA